MIANKNNKVGKFTGNYTQTGRKIYKTKAVQKGRGKGIGRRTRTQRGGAKKIRKGRASPICSGGSS